MLVGFDPRDVVADGPDLPPLFLEVGRGDQHGKVGLATCAREGGGHVVFLPLGIFDAEDEHVLGHPAFVAGHRRGDAERETFFSQQRIAAVARTVAPDFARFGEVHDVFLLVAGPRHILLALGQRGADGMHAGDDAFEIGVDQLEDFFSDARHDAHVDHDVGRVGQLHANLRHRRADRAHAERQHIHGASGHAAVEEPFERLAHLERIDPVVRRSGRLLGKRADERAVFDPCHVAGVRAGEVAARPFLLVQLDEGAGRDHLRAERVVFLLRAVDPVDGGGLAEVGHLLDPLQQMLVFGERLRGIAFFHGRERGQGPGRVNGKGSPEKGRS